MAPPINAKAAIVDTTSISSPLRQRRGREQTWHGTCTRTGDIELLIVGDRRFASPGVCTRPDSHRGIRIIAALETSDIALRVAREQKPHVCMVSAALDAGDWLSLVRRLKQLDDPPRVLVYGAPDSRATAMAVIANADGVLRRYGAPEKLGEVVNRVAAGEKLPPDLAPDEFHELLDCVDDRDRAIVSMLLERIPPDNIASTLGLSARSLRMHRQAILTRLDATRPGETSRRHQIR
jgi:DNA-binding NarL/FixJ family response regulator